MSQEYKVDFATFCHEGDVHRLHALGQLKKQVESNNYHFDLVIAIHQSGNSFFSFPFPSFPDYHCKLNLYQIGDMDIDNLLRTFDIDIDKPQYVGDHAHYWKHHVVNHLKAVSVSDADYIVFADNDCWIVNQPEGKSWVDFGIQMLQSNRDIFIVSPNDGEPERTTLRMSQQMFLARTDEFRSANFNQPGYSGNPKDYDTMPEYHAMLEGRIEYHCRQSGQYRYVCPAQYRYWHFNRLNQDGHFETDRGKY